MTYIDHARAGGQTTDPASERSATERNGSEKYGGEKNGGKRDTWLAVRRGMRNRCPACGEGRILRAYLTVSDRCPSCGEDLSHQRADDFPIYLTLFAAGHIIGAIFFFVSDMWPDMSMTAQYLTWPTLAVLLSLWLLPIFKGIVVAFQWALRMHGFGDGELDAPLDTPLGRPAV